MESQDDLTLRDSAMLSVFLVDNFCTNKCHTNFNSLIPLICIMRIYNLSDKELILLDIDEMGIMNVNKITDCFRVRVPIYNQIQKIGGIKDD